MARLLLWIFLPLFVLSTYVWANDETKDQDRLQECVHRGQRDSERSR